MRKREGGREKYKVVRVYMSWIKEKQQDKDEMKGNDKSRVITKRMQSAKHFSFKWSCETHWMAEHLLLNIHRRISAVGGAVRAEGDRREEKGQTAASHIGRAWGKRRQPPGCRIRVIEPTGARWLPHPTPSLLLCFLQPLFYPCVKPVNAYTVGLCLHWITQA